MSSEYVPALFTGLVDDAGLFPPEELPMADALARHQHDQADSSAVLTGRFLCPAARLPELLDHLASIEHLELGLISPLEAAPLQTALDSIATDSSVELVGVEGTLGEVAAL
ncbi:MAG: hypothetical protein J2P17_26095, partial [Mycobacterium sp.]|nr:hypothetical protein [Mycobacterium sp.]